MAPDPCTMSFAESFFAKLRFVNENGVEGLYIAEIHHFLLAIIIDSNGAEDVLRLVVCKLYHGLPGMQSSRDILTATVQRSQLQTVLAVDISEFDTKLVTPREGNKLYHNTSGLA